MAEILTQTVSTHPTNVEKSHESIIQRRSRISATAIAHTHAQHLPSKRSEGRSMSRYISTSRSNPCPICDKTNGNCRTFEDSKTVLCMSVTDSINPIPGFQFIGLTSDLLWGKWVSDEAPLTQQEKIARQQELNHIRQQRATAEAQRHAEALPAIERDTLYQKLLDQLPLHPADRADIHRRSLTDDQIETWGIRSVEQWQPLEELSHALPGISLDGRSLNTPRAGYLCPIRDVDGLIVGFQIRARAAGDGRYYWLTGKTKKRTNGPTPHLPNGELPLAVFRPKNIKHEAIAFVEGTGAKPYILSQKLNRITIGAAGGQFAASPKTLQHSLEQLNCKTIEFYPDAGAVQNNAVLRQYRATWKLLKSWGYTVQVAWWGQEDKRIHTDIDELQDLNQIQYLSISEFETIAARFNRLLHQLHQTLAKIRPAGFGKVQELPKPKTQTPVNLPPSTNRTQKRRQPKIQRLLAKAQQRRHHAIVRLENHRTRKHKAVQPHSLIREYQQGDRLATWQTAFEQGYRYILDISPPGTGKSYDAGRIDLTTFNLAQAIYLSDQHRNPTVATLKSSNGWCDLEARHGGLVRTATNNSSRLQRATKGSDIPVVTANCSRNGILNALRDKNVSGADHATLICGTCVLREACINATGPGYGYLNQRRDALAAPLLRAHPDSLPNPEDYPLDESLLIWDEPGQNFKVKHSINVTYTDLQQTITALMPYPKLFSQVQPLLTALLPLLDGSIPLGRYGLNHIEVKGRLPEISTNPNAIAQVLAPQLGFLNTTADYGVDLADLPKELRKKFTEQDTAIAAQAKEQVVKQWLVPLIQVLQGNPGCVQITKRGMTLSLPSWRHRTMAQAAAVNVFLDGTLSREDLALKVGCQPDEILVLRQALPQIQNLELIQVTDIGRAGMSRGADQTKRTAALCQKFRDQDATTRVIDFKRYDEDGAWWRDSRGVNDFLEVKTLVLVGTPCRNLFDLVAEFVIVSGYCPQEDDPTFSAFVHRATLAEIHQAIGRLRAHRRADESLRVVLISNVEMDVPVQQVKGRDLSPEAAHKTERVQMVIEAAILDLKAQGKKITQQVISAITGIPRGSIARYWYLFISLLENLNSKMNIAENGAELDQEGYRAIAQVLDEMSGLPIEELLSSLDEVFYRWVKPQEWMQVWERVSARGQMAILRGLAMVVPERVLVG